MLKVGYIPFGLFQTLFLDGINIGVSAYNKLILTGGLNLTDEDKIFINKDLEKKVLDFEKSSNINYERFR